MGTNRQGFLIIGFLAGLASAVLLSGSFSANQIPALDQSPGATATQAAQAAASLLSGESPGVAPALSPETLPPEVAVANRPLSSQAYWPLPSVLPQDDYWSCGPNSAARVLRFYGHDVTYGEVRSRIEQTLALPESIQVPEVGSVQDAVDILLDWSAGKPPQRTRSVDIRTGVTPAALQALIQQWEGQNAKVKRQAELGQLKRLLSEVKPVITLLQVGDINLGKLGVWPELHWVAVQGFDETQGQIYYTETNGGEYTLTETQFLALWDWQTGQDLAREAFFQNGVSARTMVWVDREVVPPLAG